MSPPHSSRVAGTLPNPGCGHFAEPTEQETEINDAISFSSSRSPRPLPEVTFQESRPPQCTCAQMHACICAYEGYRRCAVSTKGSTMLPGVTQPRKEVSVHAASQGPTMPDHAGGASEEAAVSAAQREKERRKKAGCLRRAHRRPTCHTHPH